jgi:hypothetical protein
MSKAQRVNSETCQSWTHCDRLLLCANLDGLRMMKVFFTEGFSRDQVMYDVAMTMSVGCISQLLQYVLDFTSRY